MTQEERLGRVENKLDRLQEQVHENQLELLAQLREDREVTAKEYMEVKLTTQRHDEHFGMIAKVLGLGGLVSGWLGLKDFFPHK